jgi:hypothetical protein
MSGGAFNYQQYKLQHIIDEIERVIQQNSSQEHWRYGTLSDKTIIEFKEGILALKRALIYTQRIDWLLSDDDGEETFHKRLEQELRAHALDGLAELSQRLGLDDKLSIE